MHISQRDISNVLGSFSRQFCSFVVEMFSTQGILFPIPQEVRDDGGPGGGEGKEQDG